MNTPDRSSPQSPDARRQAWSSYWAHGALHSLEGSFEGGYGGSIRRFWEEVFEGLQADDRVLDVGTGNGPLPALLCELRGDGAMPGVDAVDLASLAPRWLDAAPEACRERIRFHEGVRAEELPFEDGAFSLAISQYGIEYSDLDRSLAELARTVRPGGRIAVVMHHQGSRLAEVAGEEMRTIAAVLADGSLMQAAPALLPFLDKAARGLYAELESDPQAAQARTNYNAAMREVETLAGQSAYPDVLLETRALVAGRIAALLEGQADLDATRAALADHAQALRESRLRSRELRSHALDEAGIAGLDRRLQALGFEDVETRPIRQGMMLMGWTVRGRRAGQAAGATPV